MKKDTSPGKKIDKWKHILMKAVVKLGNLNIPSHIVYLEKKQVSHFGTETAMEKFEKSSICKCKCECDAINAITWTEALKVDGANLQKSDGAVFDQDKIRHLGTLNFISTLQKMKKLDAPLSVANYNEVTSYLRYLIRLEAQERGVKVGRFIVGREEMRPRHCWIEEDFPWSQFRTDFNHIKAKEYPGPGRLVDFFRRCIKKGLEARGIDPEKFYVDEFSDEVFRRRRQLKIAKGWLVEETRDSEGEPPKKRLKTAEDDNGKISFDNVENSLSDMTEESLVNIKEEHIEQDSLIPLSPVESRLRSECDISNEMIEDQVEDYSEIASGVDLEPLFLNKQISHEKYQENQDESETRFSDKQAEDINDYYQFDIEPRFNNGPPVKQNKHKFYDCLSGFEQQNQQNVRNNDRSVQSSGPIIYDPEILKIMMNPKYNPYISRLPKDQIYQQNHETKNDFESRIKGKEPPQQIYPANSNSEIKLLGDKNKPLVGEENHNSSFNSFPRMNIGQTTQNISKEILDPDLNLKSSLPSNQPSSVIGQDNQNSGIGDISIFLTSISLPELVDLFISEDVTMDMLSDMSVEDLKEIGVTKFGQRYKIMKSIKSMT